MSPLEDESNGLRLETRAADQRPVYGDDRLRDEIAETQTDYPRVSVRVAGSVPPVSHTLRTSCAAESEAEELLAADRRKDEFLARLAHELRSPLASIHYSVTLLGRQPGQTALQQNIRTLIERQLHRAKQLIDDLLDVSSIARGQLQLHRERVDAGALVNDAIQTLESDIDERGHRLAVSLPGAPVWIHGDAARLEQVFVNLLANAVRYTDAGGDLAISVEVRAGQAFIRVRDSGIGIAPDAMPHLFELFRQANESGPHSGPGLGIGLAIVRSIVTAHGGSVFAASAGPGRGSEFTVGLPLE